MRGGTLVHERGVVVRVGERVGARVLEEGGVHGLTARVGAVVVVPAAELVGVKSLAPALARHDGSMHGGDTVLQNRGTRGKQVGAATDHWAHAFALVRGYGHGDVKAVHEAHAVGNVVAVAVVGFHLRQGGGSGATGAVALETAAAVAAGAGEGGAGVGAAGAGPDPARPVGIGDGDGEVGEGVESEATAGEDWVAGVGLNGWPHGVVAVVNEG